MDQGEAVFVIDYHPDSSATSIITSYSLPSSIHPISVPVLYFSAATEFSSFKSSFILSSDQSPDIHATLVSSKKKYKPVALKTHPILAALPD
ncbi:hypothetical protein A0H81_02611 [Grifola frondosa]|uniref:Uncharacterized protein n=1 Tax=Grifola frondosa TaxID=5627 RepID=A0A1C7MP15_GRIFR|nr:hypothetical protein A0H81_02611 [Grifola frondosa]